MTLGADQALLVPLGCGSPWHQGRPTMTEDTAHHTEIVRRSPGRLGRDARLRLNAVTGTARHGHWSAGGDKLPVTLATPLDDPKLSFDHGGSQEPRSHRSHGDQPIGAARSPPAEPSAAASVRCLDAASPCRQQRFQPSGPHAAPSRRLWLGPSPFGSGNQEMGLDRPQRP